MIAVTGMVRTNVDTTDEFDWQGLVMRIRP